MYAGVIEESATLGLRFFYALKNLERNTKEAQPNRLGLLSFMDFVVMDHKKGTPGRTYCSKHFSCDLLFATIFRATISHATIFLVNISLKNWRRLEVHTEEPHAEPCSEERFDIQAVAEPNRKRSGEIAEAIFLAKAAGLGFIVAKPWGESGRYDFILDNGHGFLRVHVKSTGCYAGSRYLVKASGWKRRRYTSKEIDFMVAYIVPENLWYVVPIAGFASREHLCFHPHGNGTGLLEVFRESWCLMACPRVEVKHPQAKGAKAKAAKAKRDYAAASKLPASCRAVELSVRCAVCPLRK